LGVYISQQAVTLPVSIPTQSVAFLIEENKMSQRTFWRGVVVVILCVALATPAGAQVGIGRNPVPTGAIVGAVAGIAAVVVIVAVVLTHKKKITGCANANDKGMSVTDETDKQTYALSGNTTDIKAGERVRLQVKKMKSTQKGGAPTWQVEKLIKDYGSCHP
jgi:hypothetical protein